MRGDAEVTIYEFVSDDNQARQIEKSSKASKSTNLQNLAASEVCKDAVLHGNIAYNGAQDRGTLTTVLYKVVLRT